LLNFINPYARLHSKASAMSFSLLLQNIPLVYWSWPALQVRFLSQKPITLCFASPCQHCDSGTLLIHYKATKNHTYTCSPSRIHSELWLHNNKSHHVIVSSTLEISRCTPGVVTEEFHLQNTLGLWLGLRCIINAYTRKAPVGRLVCYGDCTDWVANLQIWKSPLSILWYGHRMILLRKQTDIFTASLS
jgi:hypothetical protein